jgi:hypothetical protein
MIICRGQFINTLVTHTFFVTKLKKSLFLSLQAFHHLQIKLKFLIFEVIILNILRLIFVYRKKVK